jgi:Flp pilus assembly protein TadG
MKNTIENKIPNAQKQKGATLVEFAIILPVFIIIIFGIIEFSLLLYNKGIITHAAREGARVGVVYNFGTNSNINNRIPVNDIIDEVNIYIQNNLISFNPSTPTIAVDNLDNNSLNNCPNPSASEERLRVRVNYNYSFLVLPNFIAALAGGTNLQSEAVMVCE